MRLPRKLKKATKNLLGRQTKWTRKSLNLWDRFIRDARNRLEQLKQEQQWAKVNQGTTPTRGRTRTEEGVRISRRITTAKSDEKHLSRYITKLKTWNAKAIATTA